MKPLRPITRILLAAAVLSMTAGYFLPLWEIHLWAPQYPEGLNMKIWLDHLSGDFDIINGLNHYIGMKHIKEEMFPEFGYMGYALGALVAAGLVPVLTGKRRWLQVFVAILFAAAALGLYDFWRWGRDYGHNLDPKAAISVPGMTYDPPVIGYKSLLNFVAYSGPEKGGWILISAGAAATSLLLWESLRKEGKQVAARVGPLLAVTLTLPGCDSGPVAIDYGRDACDSCRMTLVDRRFGTEFVTAKGKVYKFDDVNCLLDFMEEERASAGNAYVVNFAKENELLEVENAVFLKHPQLRTPMNSGLAAFATKANAETTGRELGGNGEVIGWEEVRTETNKSCSCAH
ncbi:MAG: nitrous oxide reductase accessory protein NosL [Verrucomicrobiae bacterium]|nr:nitrous oxide reductase accessory protein NosL [Verrucomicrobiae bacterium]